ncbi:MAG: tyrosine-type recombinase/integrase [Candidatus Rokuibacteriota bacterium]
MKLLKKRLGEMGQGQLVGPEAEKVTFEHLTQGLRDDYRINARKSLKRANEAIARLAETFALRRAVDITSDRIAAYTRARLDAGAAAATVQYELAVLKRMFTLAIRAGLLATRPYIASLEVRNTRTGFLEAGELQTVLAALPTAVRPIVEFAALTGWRRSEVLGLTWRQVDFAAGVVRLEPGTTKNDDGRTFPFQILPALAALLQRQHEYTEQVQKATGQIIPDVFHRNGRPIKDFRRVWDAACAAAGVPGRLVHDLRRSAVRRLERAGVSRSTAMKLTGHKTESVYRRYAIVSEVDLAEGVAKLAALDPGTAPASRVAALRRKNGQSTGKATTDERSTLKGRAG